MPQISSMSFGPTPAPMHADPATGFDEVTKGYVPWSMSSIVAWAPSKRIVPSLSSTSQASFDASAMYCSRRWP